MDRTVRLEETNTVESSLEKLETDPELEPISELTVVDSLEVNSVDSIELRTDKVSRLEEETVEEISSEVENCEMLEVTLDKVIVEYSLEASEDGDSASRVELDNELETLDIRDSDDSEELEIFEDADVSE